jgi:creatinine amidohydrolase
MRQAIVGFGVAVAAAAALAAQGPATPGVALGDLSWPEAEKVLTPSSVVVLPLGVATVQHGPHLKLNNNERLARHLAGRVQAAGSVVIAPPLLYHFYPTFLEYPGSTSIASNTARDMTIDIVRSLAKYGPRRFYVLNTGVTTMFPLKDAADALADHGILLGYTDMRYHLGNARVTRQQSPMKGYGAAHADEVETSIMLFVDPSAVDMRKAVREYGPGYGPMTRQKDAPGTFSASGVVGDPTVATRENGQVYVDALLSGVLEDINAIRTARLPSAKATEAAPAAPQARVPPPRPSDEKLPGGCTAGEERAIRAVGERYSYLWRQMDAEKLAGMFTGDGDMRHPDGTIERGFPVLYQNRLELFRKREYRGSVHPVQLSDIRCLAGGTAIADGKWELRFDDVAAPGPVGRGPARAKRHAGWCTLVLVRAESSWAIQAWRYTVDPQTGEPPPTTLKQPGFIGRGGGGG